MSDPTLATSGPPASTQGTTVQEITEALKRAWYDHPTAAQILGISVWRMRLLMGLCRISPVYLSPAALSTNTDSPELSDATNPAAAAA